MLKKNSGLDKNVLKIFEYMDKLFLIETNIIKTKKQSIIFFTLLAWIFDISAMSITILEQGKSIGLRTISEFIYEVTSFNNMALLSVYVIMSLSILGAISLIASLMILKTREKAVRYE